MAGSTVTVEWNGRKARAFVPDALAGFTPELSERTVRRTERAAAAVRRVGDFASGGLEVTARLLLRSEGVASSHIEGINARPDEVAVAAVDDSIGGSAAWVADNLAAIDDALGERGPLTAQSLWTSCRYRHELHYAEQPIMPSRPTEALWDRGLGLIKSA